VFDSDTLEQCRAFGQWLGENKHTMVYGGACRGLMGTMADEVLKFGGEVVGYMPRDLFADEVPHRGITKLVEVEDLFERKRLMMEDSDIFVILPGGVGTLDEFFEVLTWKSLNCFDKPILVYNFHGFWDSMLSMMKDLEDKKVLDQGLLSQFKTCQNLQSLKECVC